MVVPELDRLGGIVEGLKAEVMTEQNHIAIDIDMALILISVLLCVAVDVDIGNGIDIDIEVDIDIYIGIDIRKWRYRSWIDSAASWKKSRPR